MKSRIGKSLFVFLVLLGVAGLVGATSIYAKGGGGGLGGCPRDIECPMIWDPVTCDGGVTYPNACLAFRACATGCGSGGA